MMFPLLHPTYFPSIAHFVVVQEASKIYFEVNDHYQKQSFRNRTEIYGPNGKLALSIPVNYTQKNRQLTKDVKIAEDYPWQAQHLKSLETSYSMSPFFEFYIDDLRPVFTKKFTYLLDINLFIFNILSELLQLNFSFEKTISYESTPTHCKDFRFLANKKYNNSNYKPYTQVFTDKHGYIPNLSILDLLFNEGPATEIYIQKQIFAIGA